MKAIDIRILLLPVCLVASALALSAQAQSVETLNLGGITTAEGILNYFNGGFDQLGAHDGTGPNYGVAFGNAAYAVKETTTGGGKFENNPSHTADVLIFSGGSYTPTNAVMNVANGFTALSLSYSLNNVNQALYAGATITLYSGLNGTGSALKTVSTSALASPTACTKSTDEFCSWTALGLSNFGVAESAVFSGTPTTLGNTEFDQLTLTAVPEPSTSALVLAGLGVAGLAAGRRRTR